MATRRLSNTRNHSRVSKGRTYWETHLNAWPNSGLAQSEYCRQQGISTSAFYNWMSKLTIKNKTTDDFPFIDV